VSDQLGPFEEWALPLSVFTAVLPLVPFGKRPLLDGGHSVATQDREVIKHWGRRFPNANIGWRTGFGLVCIDVDIRNGGHETLQTFEATCGVLPETLKVRTPGGLHYWFSGDALTAHPSGGIDVLGAGSYAVAPYSVRHDGQYQLISALRQPAPLPPELLPWLLAAHPSRTLMASMVQVEQVPSRLPGERRALPVRTEHLLKRRKQAADRFDRDADVLSVMLSMARARRSFSEASAALLNPAHGLSEKLQIKGDHGALRELERTWVKAVSLVRLAEEAERTAIRAVDSMTLPLRADGSSRAVLRWAISEAASHPGRSSLRVESRHVCFTIPATVRTVGAATGLSKSAVGRATKRLERLGVLTVAVAPDRTMRSPSTWSLRLPDPKWDT